MAVEYTIDKELNVIFAKVVGDLTLDGVFDYFRALTSDPDYDPNLDRIFDSSEAVRFDLSADELETIAKQSLSTQGSTGKTAIVTGTDPARKAIAIFYKDQAQFHRSRRHASFVTAEEALAWFRDEGPEK